MAKDNTPQLLEKAREYYKDKYVIAFLGEKGFGKTIVSTLLKHALFNYFIPKNAGKFNGRVVQGFKVINDVQEYLLKGEFPPESTRENPTEVKIELTSTATMGKTIELLLQDISGEDHSRLLCQEKSGDELIKDILHFANRDDPDSFGPASYLIFAKLFVILIDCEKFKKWELVSNSLSNIFNSLHAIKTEINETSENKIINPIAIVFTKTDTLPSSVQNQSALELLKNNMKEIYHGVLPKIHSGKIGYFSVNIGTRKPTVQEFKAYKIEQEKKREIAKENLIREREDAKERAKDEAIEKAVNSAVEEATEKAKNEGKQGDALQAEIDNAEEIARREAEIEFEANYEEPPLKTIEPIKENEKDLWKVKTPLTYTSGEYMKLISWLIEALN